MGKNKKSSVPGEEHLHLPVHSALASSETRPPIVDTHTHLVSTFSAYRGKYKQGKYETIYDFVRGLYRDRNVEAIVDVWCEAPVQRSWRELADSALSEEDRRDKWGGVQYWFVMGVHPHEASQYTDEVEKDILEAMAHPRCVGWGEIGLDYHYDNSPRDIQQTVFVRQLQQAVRLGKPLTIHTREAEEDTERILKEHVPKEHKIHIHCYTDSPEWAARMLDHFPRPLSQLVHRNHRCGLTDLAAHAYTPHTRATGVITYSTNLNTSSVVRQMSRPGSHPPAPLRVLLETDAPFMVPANLYGTLTDVKGRLPLCHTGMIPWTAEFVAAVANEGGESAQEWSVERIMLEARDNARRMYGV